MKEINSDTPGLAWKKALNLVYFQGDEISDGNKKLKELLNVFITIKNPVQIDEVLKRFGDMKMIELMKDNFLKQESAFEGIFSYGSRIFNYHGINQLESIISKLSKNPESKSAVINFLDPSEDKSHIPCICTLDIKIRNDKLIGTAFFRSQDVGKKLYADIIALGSIMENISKILKITLGELNILAVSLHLYQEDLPLFSNILEN